MMEDNNMRYTEWIYKFPNSTIVLMLMPGS